MDDQWGFLAAKIDNSTEIVVEVYLCLPFLTIICSVRSFPTISKSGVTSMVTKFLIVFIISVFLLWGVFSHSSSLQDQLPASFRVTDEIVILHPKLLLLEL